MNEFKVTGILKVDVAAGQITARGYYEARDRHVSEQIAEFPTGINLIDEPEDLLIAVENGRLQISQETGKFVYQYAPSSWVQLPKEEK